MAPGRLRRWRPLGRWLAVALPALSIAAVSVPPLLWYGRLPDPIATHWTAGVPDGNLPLRTAVVVLLVVSTLSWLAAAVARARHPRTFTIAVPASYFLGGLLAAAGVLAIVLNLDALTWREARTPATGVTAVPFWVGALCALIGALSEVARSDGGAVPDRPAGRRRPSAGLSEHARVVWHARVRNAWVTASFCAPALLLAVIPAAAGREAVAAGVVALGVLVAAAAETVVTISRRGITVGYGPFGKPARHLALDSVRSASVVPVEPRRFGGWGYRLRPGGVTAVIVRRGPALRVDTVDGRSLLVTIPRAEQAAGVLNDLLDQAAPGRAADR